jgi:hypothetical protein
MATTSPIKQLTSYSDADLKAAAAKLQSSGYSRYSPTYILNQAKTDASMASNLLKFLPAAPGSTTAAKPAAPATILPDPAKATTQSTTVSGKTYYLSPAKSGQPATWVTQTGSSPGLFAVDQTGKTTGTKPAFTSTLDWQNQTAVAFGASKPTAAQQAAQTAATTQVKPAAPVAPTPATKTPAAPAGPEQFGGVTPPNRLNLPDATTAFSKIISNDKSAPPTMKTDSATGTTFYLAPPTGKTPAMWVAVAKGSTTASNGQTVQALNKAQIDYIDPKQTTQAETVRAQQQAVVDQQQAAEQQRLAQQGVSKEQEAYNTAEAQRQAAAKAS